MFNEEMLKEALKKRLKEIYDELNRFLSVILLILIIVGFFTKNFILDLLKLLLLVLIIFRLVSKNRLSRQKENNIYLKIRNHIIHPFTSHQTKDRFHVYKRCPKCKTILKLPLPAKAGLKHAKCPNCEYRVSFITFKHKKKEKVEVEVIKKKK